MKPRNLRKSFLDYFKKQGHTIVPSDSLVPSSDPSLLFTSAGMVQFKAHFLQQVPLTFRRAASSQRCIRTTDIDQVGFTPRHLTLFEMLGNFSFGDYFKEDAIKWAWDFFTKELDLPEKRLFPSIYKDDDEAFKIWKKIVPESKIARMGEESNFWTMGPTGPCGPCSEIYWNFDLNGPSKMPDDSDQWMEIWNLVFTQYDRGADGSLNPLPQKNIDTGMGLERLTSVVEGVGGNFETSLFQPLLQFGQETLKYKKGTEPKKDFSLNIIADHLRAVTMLIYDGILPGNEGRGYVLRRLLRRAVRQGSLFGIKEPFIYKGVPIVANLLGETADDLKGRVDNIEDLVKQEEERFLETIDTGVEKLNEVIKSTKGNSISGKDVFRLYDTYGFPPELTKEILSESNLTFDQKEFDSAREGAQSMAREGWKGSGAKDVTAYNTVLKSTGPSEFIGYHHMDTVEPVKAILVEGKETDILKAGQTGELITNKTPFYPEGGGQVGDKGFLNSADGKRIGIITDAQKPVPGLIIHIVKAEKEIKKGDSVQWSVDPQHRQPTMQHHTATHLLHAALRNILGKTVTQAGSLVAPDRLRFDYTFNRPPKPEELKAIEDQVNEIIQKNLPAQDTITTPDVARKMGAMALFGEKYGDQVRCLIISENGFDKPEDAYSLELCGGTHCHASGDIGLFKIVSDTSIASGVRRMEAMAGFPALNYFRNIDNTFQSLAERLKVSTTDVGPRIQKLLDKQKQLEQEIRDLKLSAAQGGGSSNTASSPEVQNINGIPVAVKINDGLETKDLRTLADRLKQQMKSGVILAASTIKDEDREKVSFVIAVSPDLKEKGVHAGQLAKALAAELGGSGGGRPDFAQGGGQDKAKLDAALKKLPSLIKQK